MTAVYHMLGITRQAAWQQRQRAIELTLLAAGLRELVRDIRHDHPQMGLRKIYTLLEPPGIGRDRFEALLQAEGLGVLHSRPPWVTTHSVPQHGIPNLIAGRDFDDAHQVWMTDITYFRLSGRFAYIVTIMELYTRIILAMGASLTLSADENILALNTALAFPDLLRGEGPTIHHSDGGSQYIDTEYQKLLARHQFLCSMGGCAQENPYVERVQGTIKNEYLRYRSIHTIEELHREVVRAQWLYNYQRPHQSLPHMMTPIAFAAWVRTIPQDQRPIVHVHDWSAQEQRS
jgi:putative transposase